MEQKALSIEKFNDLLNNWTGKEIKILKQEVKDLDETIILLDQTTYRKNIYRVDDYEAKYELLLKGTGFIENENGEFEPLPESTYEIALDDNSTYQFDGIMFSINSDRGQYTIQLTSPTEI